MSKLLFVAEWEKDKKKTWSGTTYNLYKSLGGYFDIEEISLNKEHLLIFLSKIGKISCKLKGKSDMDYHKFILGEYFIKNKNNIPSLVFSEYKINNYINEYIFQDLSVSYLRYLYDNDKELFDITPFNLVDYEYLCKREQLQLEFYRKCKAIFVMGEWLKNDLVNRNKIDEKKIHVVGGGINVNPSLIDYSKKKGNKILFVGSDFRIKNGYLVVDAFKKAREIKKDLELYIIGNNVKVKEEGVYVLGELNHDEIINYYNMCDIFCMPSLHEGYGIAFIEALTFGLPCIARNAYEMPYLIKDGVTGRLLNNRNDSDELARLMLETIDNEKMKNNVRLKKDEYIKKYSWDEVARRIYLNVIE